ncbi:hypothetical protein [Lysobacter gummosus]
MFKPRSARSMRGATDVDRDPSCQPGSRLPALFSRPSPRAAAPR